MASYESLLDAVGGTPLIRLTRAAQGLRPRVYVKPEWQNPGASVKDRAALSMIRRAEADGSLRPGGTVVEVTSGNTGIGLALAAAHLGYRAVVFTSSSTSREKRDQLAAYGADVRLVDAFVPRDHPGSMRSQGMRFAAATPGAWFADQYDNPANPAAHYTTTGPEIWTDTEGAVTHFVATVGTGGTVTGTGRFLKEASGGRVRVIGADPVTSLYSGGDGSQKYIEGAGHFLHPDAAEDTWPRALDTGVIDHYVTVEDQEAIDAVRRLARTEGILAGGSSGVALAAALRVARDLTEDDTVVVLLPDSGRAYLSTYFNDRWLAANGFHGGEPAAGPLVGDRATPAPLVERDEDAAEAARRLTAAGAGEDDVVLAAYPRGGRRLAPHPTDLLGWTTPGLLRAAPSVTGAVRPFGPRLGAGLPLADPAVTGWVAADGEVAQVLHHGRVTGTVRWHAVRADPPTARPAAEPASPAAQPAPPLRLSGQEREAIAGLLRFPLLAAVNGRRSRRFPVGGRIPSGELAFTSTRPVQPLSEAERALVLAVVTGVTGWNFGISHHPGYAPALPNYPGSAVGRTFPSAAGFHTTDFFFTDDSGTYFLSTRDAAPAGETGPGTGPGAEPDIDAWLNATTARYRKLSAQRLWLPREEPYLEGHNTWIANHPGSLLVVPVADLAQHLIANLAFFLQNGYGVYDDVNGRPLPGAHDPSLRHAGDPFPLSFVEQYTLAEASAELITGVYNGHLLLGAMGLGGWTFDGIDRLSVLGASGRPDVPGLGFHVQHDERWALPNPTGLTGVFETLSRPHVADAAEAVERFTERKFGPGGPFHPATPGPWRDTRGVRASAAPYDERFVRLLTGQVRYIDETFGKIPGTVPTVHILNYLQAQHLDPDFYDHHFTPAAYLPTHRDHPSTWH
ncbi:PLP-dependent cysteine synthase family protein [Streptomyces sp. NPDC004031]